MIPYRSQRGFSLIELAIVLVILGLLIGSGFAALTAATEQARRSEAERQLIHVRDALYGFAMSQGRIPCPDDPAAPDGNEDLTGGTCDHTGGALPWVDLQLGRRDAWGSLLRYRVDPNYADTNTSPAFDLTDSGNLEVRDADANLIVDTTPAVVVSFGPQGSQVWTDAGYTCPAAGTNGFSTDENENCDDDGDFIYAEYRPPDATGGRFDDVVIWVPNTVLLSRMVDAGLLP